MIGKGAWCDVHLRQGCSVTENSLGPNAYINTGTCIYILVYAYINYDYDYDYDYY